MPNKSPFLSIALSVALLAGCASGSGVAVADRERLLVDSRFDAAVAADTAAARFMEPYARVVDSLMCPVVGRTATYLTSARPESPLSNLLADILLWAAKDYGEHPDMAVYNMGGIRASLPEGDVTFGDVLEVAPFENKICFLTLRGDTLLSLFSEMAEVGGEGVSHGVELTISPDGRLLGARLGGKPIDGSAAYRVATIDYLAEGNDRMEAFKKKTDYNAPRDETNDTRYIIANYFREQAAKGVAVDAKVEGRITVATR